MDRDKDRGKDRKLEHDGVDGHDGSADDLHREEPDFALSQKTDCSGSRARVRN